MGQKNGHNSSDINEVQKNYVGADIVSHTKIPDVKVREEIRRIDVRSFLSDLNVGVLFSRMGR